MTSWCGRAGRFHCHNSLFVDKNLASTRLPMLTKSENKRVGVVGFQSAVDHASLRCSKSGARLLAADERMHYYGLTYERG